MLGLLEHTVQAEKSIILQKLTSFQSDTNTIWNIYFEMSMVPNISSSSELRSLQQVFTLSAQHLTGQALQYLLFLHVYVEML